MGCRSQHPRILFVSRCGTALTDLALALATEGFETSESRCGDPALEVLSRNGHSVVVLQTCGSGENGLGTLIQARARQYPAEFIVVDQGPQDDFGERLEALAVVAHLIRPVSLSALRGAVHKALHIFEVRRVRARQRLEARQVNGNPIVGSSDAMACVHELMERVSRIRVPVLLTGETGTGKELVARHIHDMSPRSGKAFVPVSCAAVPKTLAESTLFGHVRGSFTGAVGDRKGLLERAEGGTVLLDDVDSIGPALQAKLLRVVQDGTIQRVGDRHDIPVDFRLISTTNVDLSERVRDGRFRQDLFYRLNVFPIHLPPLRDRAEDVPLLASYFRDVFAAAHGLEPLEIPRCCMEWLVDYSWPGNVRELKHTIERAMVLSQGKDHITGESVAHLWNKSSPVSWAKPLAEEWTLERLQEEYLTQVLRKTGGHKANAARILGIDRRTLYRKLRRGRRQSLAQQSGWTGEDDSSD